MKRCGHLSASDSIDCNAHEICSLHDKTWVKVEVSSDNDNWNVLIKMERGHSSQKIGNIRGLLELVYILSFTPHAFSEKPLQDIHVRACVDFAILDLLG